MKNHSDVASTATARVLHIAPAIESDKDALIFKLKHDNGHQLHSSLDILNVLRAGIIVSDGSGRIVYMNSQAETITGYPSEKVVGRPVIDILLDSNYDLIGSGNSSDNSASEMGGYFTVQLETRSASRRSVEIRVIPLPDHIAGTGGELYEIYDVSESLKHTRKLLHDATHDPLTGLANRRALMDRLAQCVHWQPDPGAESILAMLDLDGFKSINDNCGHIAGDNVLQAIARTLQSLTRKADLTARLGGDEFVVLLISCGIEESYRILNAIRAAIGAYRYVVDGNEFRITASIGAACIEVDNMDVSNLLRRADKACYRSKHAGGNRIVMDTGSRYGNNSVDSFSIKSR